MTLVNSPTTEAVLRLTENLLGILLAGGIDPQDAAWACDVLVMLVTAVAREEEVRRPRGQRRRRPHEQIDEIYMTFVGLAPERFPLLSPTPPRWWPVMGTSAFTSPSTLSSRAWSPRRSRS